MLRGVGIRNAEAATLVATASWCVRYIMPPSCMWRASNRKWRASSTRAHFAAIALRVAWHVLLFLVRRLLADSRRVRCSGSRSRSRGRCALPDVRRYRILMPPRHV